MSKREKWDKRVEWGEWEEEDEKIVVRRSGRHTSEDIHRALFPKRAPKPRKLAAMKEGIRRYLRGRHARH